MRAVQLVEFAGPDGLRLVNIPEPAVQGQVVVELYTSGVAYPDLLQTRGGYQLVRELPAVLGLEGAGVVRWAPDGYENLIGTRVAVFTTAGTWQEVVAVEPHSIFLLPDETSYEAGAGSLLNYLTAHFALTERARARGGDTVLIHGASGGVGSACLRVARALHLSTIAVVGSPRKSQVAADAMATHVISDLRFADTVRDLTNGRGADIVLDPVGGSRLTDSLGCLAPGGRAVVVGFAGGEIPTVAMDVLSASNIAVTGAGWAEFARKNPSYPQWQWQSLIDMVRAGDLDFVEPAVYSMEQAADVLRRLDDRSSVGKAVLSLRP